VVVLVEVARKAYLASIVPVIVNAILNEHQIIVDIVAFVNKGDFPRSRLSEKQRGKILAGWVSRKMRTMAQFAIKDMDGTIFGPPGTSGGEPSPINMMGGVSNTYSGDVHRDSMGSFRSGGQGYPVVGGGSSLRNVEPAPHILEHELQQQQYAMENLGFRDPPAPLGLVEMPADERQRDITDNDQTPTKNTQFNSNRVSVAAIPHGYELPDFDRFGDDEEARGPQPPPVGRKPLSPPGTSASQASFGFGGQQQRPQQPQQNPPPQIRLPGVDGRESFDDWDLSTTTMNLAGTLGKRIE
jgi:hypothetical protein